MSFEDNVKKSKDARETLIPRVNKKNIKQISNSSKHNTNIESTNETSNINNKNETKDVTQKSNVVNDKKQVIETSSTAMSDVKENLLSMYEEKNG